jgi:hypothetical protein
MALLRSCLAACELALFAAAMAAITLPCLVLDPEVKAPFPATHAHNFTPAVSSPAERLAGVSREIDDAGLFYSSDRPNAIAALLRERP